VIFLNGCLLQSDKYSEEHAQRFVAVWCKAGEILDSQCSTAAKLYLRKMEVEGKITKEEKEEIMTKLKLNYERK
jgi:hypothetical protein